MVSKPRVKNQKDKIQDKRIAKLERQFPSVNEVANSSASLEYTDTVQSHVYSLLPSALDSQKVELRGYSSRININQGLTAPGGDPPATAKLRCVMLIYKCTADYSGASPSYTAPLPNDIFNSNTDKTLANYNPDNVSRMRIMFDRTINTNIRDLNTLVVNFKNYKKTVSFMPLVDKAFVLRPFLIVVASGTTSTIKATVAHDTDILTRQMP